MISITVRCVVKRITVKSRVNTASLYNALCATAWDISPNFVHITRNEGSAMKGRRLLPTRTIKRYCDHEMIGSVSNHVLYHMSNIIKVKHSDVDMVKHLRNNKMLFRLRLRLRQILFNINGYKYHIRFTCIWSKIQIPVYSWYIIKHRHVRRPPLRSDLTAGMEATRRGKACTAMFILKTTSC